MRFANLKGSRIAAAPQKSGTCPSCGDIVVAKCGIKNVWHWAHKGRRNCDDWWENETEWHRAWKLKFPDEWTEVVQKDHSGEKHIADVKTSDGLVIEFQHSRIDDTERRAREQFYKEMVWVVDGRRLKRDGPTFFEHINFVQKFTRNTDPIVFNGAGCQITRRWMDSEKLIYLDFGEDHLWCISPHRHNWQFFTTSTSKLEFIQACMAGRSPEVVRQLLSFKHSS